MGFLDFLKKEDSAPASVPSLETVKPDELSFGQENLQKDDFNEVPVPPQQFKDEQESTAEPTMTESLMPQPENTAPANLDTLDLPPEEKTAPGESLTLDDVADMPLVNPSDLNTEEGDVPNIPIPDFAQPQEAELAPAPALPEDASAQEVVPAESLDIPDLPSLPAEALEGAIDLPEENMPGPEAQETQDILPPVQPEEDTNPFLSPVGHGMERAEPEVSQEELAPGFSTAALDTEESIGETVSGQRLDEAPEEAAPLAPLPTPASSTAKLADETGDTPAERIKYLPEHKDEEIVPVEDYYVDSHKFYEVLQDIKTVKRTVKTNDSTMRAIEANIAAAENKAETLIGAVDDIQEKLIAIDTGLFER